MRTILLAWWVIFAIATHAQKAPIKFGDVSLDDLKMTRYSLDTAATAVVLTDYGKSVIEYNQSIGFFLNFEKNQKSKNSH